MLSEDTRMRPSFASRLCILVSIFSGECPLWPNQQQTYPHSPPYSLQPVNAVAPSTTQPVLIARNHDSRACAFALGELARRSHTNFQLLRFSADNWAIEVRLMQRILDAAGPR